MPDDEMKDMFGQIEDLAGVPRGTFWEMFDKQKGQTFPEKLEIEYSDGEKETVVTEEQDLQFSKLGKPKW